RRRASWPAVTLKDMRSGRPPRLPARCKLRAFAQRGAQAHHPQPEPNTQARGPAAPQVRRGLLWLIDGVRATSRTNPTGRRASPSTVFEPFVFCAFCAFWRLCLFRIIGLVDLL